MKSVRQQKAIRLLGINLKNLREAKGFTQKDLAFATDLEISQISRIERGVINTSIAHIIKISDALELSHKVLLDFNLEE